MIRLIQLAAAVALSCAMSQVHADDAAPPTASAPSKHKLMKDCMAKEKASDTQMTSEQREQMKKTCRDVTNTEEENVQTEKAESDKAAGRSPAPVRSPAPAPATP